MKKVNLVLMMLFMSVLSFAESSSPIVSPWLVYLYLKADTFRTIFVHLFGFLSLMFSIGVLTLFISKVVHNDEEYYEEEIDFANRANKIIKPLWILSIVLCLSCISWPYIEKTEIGAFSSLKSASSSTILHLD